MKSSVTWRHPAAPKMELPCCSPETLFLVLMEQQKVTFETCGVGAGSPVWVVTKCSFSKLLTFTTSAVFYELVHVEVPQLLDTDLWLIRQRRRAIY